MCSAKQIVSGLFILFVCFYDLISLDATVQQTAHYQRRHRFFSSYDNLDICVVQFPVIFEIKGGEDEEGGMCWDEGDGSGFGP